MIEVSDPCTILYRFGHSVESDQDLDIRYAYMAPAVQVSDLDVVYQVALETDRWERQAGFWAWSTQEIGNLFARWQAARINTGGQTQQLINAWGMGFDDAKKEYARFRKDLFLDTAEVEQPDLFFHAPTVAIKDPEKSRFTNFLTNAAFSFRGLARRRLPLWWGAGRAESTGTVELVESPAFVGTHSVRLHAAAGERAYLRQVRNLVVPANTYLTASLWYMVPIPAGHAVADDHLAGIAVKVVYANGSAEIFRAPLSVGTAGKWRRAHVSFPLSGDSHSITFTVQIENDSADPIRLYAGAAQLEASDTVTPWTSDFVTRVPTVNEGIVVQSPVDAFVEIDLTETTETIAGGPVTYMARERRHLLFVDSFARLWYDSLPSRAVMEAVDPSPDATQRSSLGWYSNPERERFTTAWRITDNRIEQYNREVTHEVFARFDIGEMHLDEDGRTMVGIASSEEDPSFVRTIEAICVFKNKLWAMCKETEGNRTVRVLKVLNPHSRWPIPLAYEQGLPSLHLECLGDVELPVSSGTGTYIGVVDDDPSKFLVTISGTDYEVSLEYDCFLFDARRNQAILRTSYDGTLVTT